MIAVRVSFELLRLPNFRGWPTKNMPLNLRTIKYFSLALRQRKVGRQLWEGHTSEKNFSIENLVSDFKVTSCYRPLSLV